MPRGFPGTPSMTSDGAGNGLPTSLDGVAPGIATGLACGRLLFNRADFWGSHEALERAWRLAPGQLAPLLQGLIQAAAAFHKLVVQDDPVGAGKLLRSALMKLEPYPDDAMGLDLVPLRAELREWLERATTYAGATGSVVGLPRLEWTVNGMADRITVESVTLHQVENAGRRAILVSAQAADAVGWGECRHPWDAFGVWDSLVLGLVPALLSEPVSAPGELTLRWSDFADARYSRAGLEAAVWDLWAQRRRQPLCEALGHEPRDVPLLGNVPPGDVEGLMRTADRCIEGGFRQLLLPARPNADRRVLPGLARHVGVPFALELGASYRAADVAALRCLDDLGAALLVQPAPTSDLATSAALGRWLDTPISLGGWADAGHLASALDLARPGAIHVDPGLAGLTECTEMLEIALERGVPAWVQGSSTTRIGAAADLALAAHPAVTLPSVVCGGSDLADAVCVAPDEDGAALPARGPGLGAAPEPEWLERVATRHAVLRA